MKNKKRQWTDEQRKRHGAILRRSWAKRKRANLQPAPAAAPSLDQGAPEDLTPAQAAGFSTIPEPAAIVGTIAAVLHQLERGEASDVLAGHEATAGAIRDLCWCRDQLWRLVRAPR